MARKKRIPKLAYTDNRGIGWYVAYRDPVNGQPTKHRFHGCTTKAQANVAYEKWLADFLVGKLPKKPEKVLKGSATPSPSQVVASISKGSVLAVATDLVAHDKRRVRAEGEPKTRGKITQKEFESIRKLAKDFLAYLNDRHGQGTVARLKVEDLQMLDVEGYNLRLVHEDYSQSQVRKRMQVAKNIIDRAGRPEHGSQTLSWNWDAKSSYFGRPDKQITLPTVKQLKLILANCNEQRTAIIWMAIGLGFGQGDLAKARVRHFDAENYDMRRGKTGIERYAAMPPRVWHAIKAYLDKTPREPDDLLFVTETGKPLVHGTTDSIQQWWERTREGLKDGEGKPAGEGLNGFYSLRHAGATEFGSRQGCSLAAMRGWLGHSKSSNVADRYMRPLSPEHKPLIQWLRESLQSTGRLK